MSDIHHMTAARPKLPAELPVIRVAGPCGDDDLFADGRIESCAFTGRARRVSFTRVCLRSVRFQAALPAAEMEDVQFDGCDLSNVDWSDAILVRVVFRNCRMTGVNFSGASLKDVVWENGAAEYANFRFARLERADFTGCNCRSADFGQAAFSRVRFDRSNLQQAQFSGVPLCGMDFTSCGIDGLGARPEDLRGAILSPEQAVTAAQIIGVRIRF